VAHHEIPLERRTLHGHFSRELEPVLTVEPGDSIAFSCLNSGWRDAEHVPYAERAGELDAGHALIGPVEVRGARAAQTLDADSGVGRTESGREVSISPFLGVIGMPPDEPGIHPTAPPRACGGNIDCRELVAGTTLYLPIAVDGALLSAGDGHAAQGDGEVSQLAIEAPVERAQLTLSLRDDLRLTTPIAWTPEAWLTFGFDEDLEEAAAVAVDAMLELMGREHGLERREALALASVVVDLRVTQLVNGARGIHARLAHDAVRWTTI